MIDNITLYKTFVAVAQSGSISGAARSLFISQPAVSAEIAQLEDKLSTKLFFRTNKGVSLTPEGELLFDYIERGFTYLEAGEDKLREIAGLSDGILRVGASDMTLRFFLLDYIEAFHNSYPGVRLSITNAPTPQTLEALRAGLLDFGVVSDDGEFDSFGEEFTTIDVLNVNDIFVATPDHPLAKQKNVTQKQLLSHPLILLERNTSTRRYVDRMLGGIPRPAIELATSDLILEFARRGMGVASIVENFAKDDLKLGNLVRVDLENPLPPRRFVMVYLTRLELSAAAKTVINSITKKEIKK